MGTIWRDKSGKTQELFDKIIKKDYPDLANAKMLYTFRDAVKTDDDGGVIFAEARKIPNGERDRYGFDFEILVDEEAWTRASKLIKKRVAWHELKHCRLSEDTESGELERDAAGRLVTWIEPHDVVIKTFKDEILKYGLTTENDIEVAKFMHGAYRKYLKTGILGDELDEVPKTKKKKE